MRATLRTLAATWLGLLLLSVSPAAAQLTYVSTTGNDANNCFAPTAPCKTLQRGINQTAAGGELRVLSQLISNGFINKSMTIDAEGHAIVGTFIVNGASAVVTFRRMVLTGRGVYPTGFDIGNAAAVHIRDSTVERYTGSAIFLAGDGSITTEMFVSNIIERESNFGLLFSAVNAKLTIVDSRFENNSDTGVLMENGRASIQRSAFLNNSNLGLAMTAGSTNVTESIAAGNNTDGFFTDAEVTLDRCVASGNGVGFRIAAGTARVSNSTFTNNGTGVRLFTGTLLTLGNNLIANNTTNFDDGPFDTPMTPLAGL